MLADERIRAAMSGRRLSSTAATYSAGVVTFSCPFIASLFRATAGDGEPQRELVGHGLSGSSHDA